MWAGQIIIIFLIDINKMFLQPIGWFYRLHGFTMAIIIIILIIINVEHLAQSTTAGFMVPRWADRHDQRFSQIKRVIRESATPANCQ